MRSWRTFTCLLYRSVCSADGERARCQHGFAKHPGAGADPTAALHVAEGVLDGWSGRGVQQASVTLHVGAGTFQPVKTDNLAEHKMHSEWYRIPAETLQAIDACRKRGGRVVAVGTTTVRTLESLAQTGQTPADTLTFIPPGFYFQGVDALLPILPLPQTQLCKPGTDSSRLNTPRSLDSHGL